MDPYYLPFAWNSSDNLEYPSANLSSTDSITLLSSIPTPTKSQYISSFQDFQSPLLKQDTGFINAVNILRRSQSSISKSDSKSIQHYFAKCQPQKMQTIIELIAPRISVLMTDLYGNYMCQTLVQSCSPLQRLLLLESMSPHLQKIARNSRGTHSLQVLVNLASLSQQERVFSEAFRGNVLNLSKDFHGCHVIERILVVFKNSEFVINQIVGHTKELACNKTGLCVIKKCVKNFAIFRELMQDILILLQDPYGNYAIQLIIENWKEECSTGVLEVIRGKIAQLAIQKYASNVIEKCLLEESIAGGMVSEMMEEENMKTMLGCPYGCYVLKTLANTVCGQTKENMKSLVWRLCMKINQKQLQSRWEEILRILG